ncbi:hypothetical protein ACFY40_11545 [Streptomyces sp. NPDC012950]|uniref:hypothetical protein n=1 Tax=Streptomyces sp. NPDC012950 TaxID=3364858 RepID=UPI0036B96965
MNGYTSTTITAAGLAVAIALIGNELYRWWKGGTGGAPAAAGGGGGGRNPKALIPFGSGIGFGTLMVACPAGLLGTGAGFLRWGGNSFGDFLMRSFTGQTSTTIASGAAPALDGNGALVVTAIVLLLILLRKAFAKVAKGKFWKGVLTGTLIGIGTGVFAVVGQLVIPSVNTLGAQLLGAVVNGVLV